jgi:uroporphyrinogen III methyltransferase/synthase
MGIGTGKVYLVGAGPGSPDLITLRGLRVLRRADLIICDSLLADDFLERLGIDGGAADVWALEPGETRDHGGELCRRMVEAAREGKTVARLKGGDPLVFGRAHEELECLSAAGVPWEVVPGPSAATAALSQAGMPLTWRGTGRSFAAVTARTAGGGVLERFPRADTLVVFMPVGVLEHVVESLLGQGWSERTPTVLLERASMRGEREVRAPRAQVARRARAEGVGPPALLVVGRGAQDRATLRRRRVLFTGVDPTNFRFLGRLLHWPALRTAAEPASREAEEALADLRSDRFDWVVFTSKEGVRFFLALLLRSGVDARLLAGARVAACGPGTAARLVEAGIRPDAVPQAAGGEGLARALRRHGPGRLLLVQGAQAPGRLANALRRAGASARRLALHRAVPNPELGRPLPQHDVIYFTSPSGVQAYRDVYGEAAFAREVWCIGDVTRRALGRMGINATVVSPHVPESENATSAAV